MQVDSAPAFTYRERKEKLKKKTPTIIQLTVRKDEEKKY
jgi:hypothetical protein